jgi:hypothetical protein
MKPKPKPPSKADRLRNTDSFARGGSTRMFKPQAAGPAKPAITGKAQTAAPGAKSAKGGKPRPVGGTAVPAGRPAGSAGRLR